MGAKDPDREDENRLGPHIAHANALYLFLYRT
jgi:hypothetical protein